MSAIKKRELVEYAIKLRILCPVTEQVTLMAESEAEALYTARELFRKMYPIDLKEGEVYAEDYKILLSAEIVR